MGLTLWGNEVWLWETQGRKAEPCLLLFCLFFCGCRWVRAGKRYKRILQGLIGEVTKCGHGTLRLKKKIKEKLMEERAMRKWIWGASCSSSSSDVWGSGWGLRMSSTRKKHIGHVCFSSDYVSGLESPEFTYMWVDTIMRIQSIRLQLTKGSRETAMAMAEQKTVPVEHGLATVCCALSLQWNSPSQDQGLHPHTILNIFLTLLQLQFCLKTFIITSQKYIHMLKIPARNRSEIFVQLYKLKGKLRYTSIKGFHGTYIGQG